MAAQTHSATLMVKMIETSPALLERFKKEDLIPVLKELAPAAEALSDPAYYGDKALYRIAVTVLGLLTLFSAVGSFVLVLGGKDTPEVLVALGSAAVGGLVGLFAPSPITKETVR